MKSASVEKSTESFVVRFVGFGFKPNGKKWTLVNVHQVAGQDYWIVAKDEKTQPDIADLRKNLGNKCHSSEIKKFFSITNRDFSVFKDKIESQFNQFQWYWL